MVFLNLNREHQNKNKEAAPCTLASGKGSVQCPGTRNVAGAAPMKGEIWFLEIFIKLSTETPIRTVLVLL